MRIPVCLLSLAAAAASSTLAAAPARPTAPVGFETFQLISERNIFDPGRAPRSSRTIDDAPRGDTLALVGTMRYEKGLFAFFDGSLPAFRKALHEGDTVADYTVTRIDQRGVELTRNGQKTPLAIGQQLQRPPGGDWSAVAIDTPPAPTPSSGTGSAAVPASSDSLTPPPGASDVLKRLMEQRQKQLKP
ncbi:MAG: hypothetical protein KF715_21720 [Candidatus Didemnitutus sp.]|nr:hypothetical protein [Candidatus Didemnitutus sp.]